MERKTEHETAYAAIYSDLRKQIFSGALKPGDLLPSENQLCERFGVSRETVRKGLKVLDTEGLIYSKPKVGYFVSTPNHSALQLQLCEDLDGCTTQYCDIHGILPDERLQNILEIPASRKVIELSQLIMDRSGTPVAFDIKYVPYERAYPSVEQEIRYAVLPDVTLSKIASYEYYTEVKAGAVLAEGRIAEALQYESGTPLMLIEQVYIHQNGSRVGYSMHYVKNDFAGLSGTSGHRI